MQVAALEERLAGKTELEREKDTEAVKSKKLMKLIEKYKRELQEAHFEIREMKSQLLEGSQFRVSLSTWCWIIMFLFHCFFLVQYTH